MRLTMNETAPLTLRIKDKLNKGLPLNEEEVMGLAALKGPDLFDLFSIANRLRAKLGNTVEFCAITKAKSGSCPEDCREKSGKRPADDTGCGTKL